MLLVGWKGVVWLRVHRLRESNHARGLAVFTRFERAISFWCNRRLREQVWEAQEVEKAPLPSCQPH